MKIALCFSGQPRFIPLVAPFILKNVCEGYKVDVFAHLWFDELLTDKPYKYGGNGGWESQRISATSIDDFKEIYKPVALSVEASKDFKDSTLKTDYSFRKDTGELVPWTKHWKECQEPDYTRRIINNNLSYHYSLNRVSLLKKEFEHKNGFKYDYVVKCRTDTIVKNKIYYEEFDKDTVYYTNILNQPDGMIADWINFGGSDVMDVLMGGYSVIGSLINKCNKDLDGAWCNEIIHKNMLDIFGVKNKSVFIDVDIPRF